MKRFAAATALLLTLAALLSLGAWQLERRTWKHALIAQVERRLAAAPVPAPGPAQWRDLGPDDAYRRIVARGRLRLDRQVFVQALTRIGPGFWAMAPLETDRGFTVLVNRGFVPADGKALSGGDNRIVTVSGLLRQTEPAGGFLRANRPAEDRWYSRDVEAIARRHALAGVAPYFIDEADVPGRRWPRGGLTVTHFPDNHLQYALTWFAMATLLSGAGLWIGLRRRRGGPRSGGLPLPRGRIEP